MTSSNKQQLDTRAGHVRSLLRDLRPATGPTITIGIMHPAGEDDSEEEELDPVTGKPRKKKGPDEQEESDSDLFPGAPDAAEDDEPKSKKGAKK